MTTVRPGSWSSHCRRGWAQAARLACAVALAGCGVELELTSLRSARPFSIVGNARLSTALVEAVAAQLDEQSRPKAAGNAGDTLGLRNPCPWTKDGEYDERSLCAEGTDSEDCNLLAR